MSVTDIRAYVGRHSRADSWKARLRTVSTRQNAEQLLQAYAECRDEWTMSERTWWEMEAARVLQEVAGDE